MKKIGIIFAMKEELEEFINKIEILKNYSIFDLNFYEARIKNLKIILAECGVGKVNAARTAQILIDNMDVDYIINVGVAGSISKDLNIGDIVIGQKLVQHDFDITAFSHEKGYIPNVGVYIFSDDYLVKLANKVGNDIKTINFVCGTIASGDIFCTELAMGQKINKKFNALCVEMEGAAVAHACYLSNIPFLIIRSISDSPNNDNVKTYDEFLKESCKKVSEFLILMLNELNY